MCSAVAGMSVTAAVLCYCMYHCVIVCRTWWVHPLLLLFYVDCHCLCTGLMGRFITAVVLCRLSLFVYRTDG